MLVVACQQLWSHRAQGRPAGLKANVSGLTYNATAGMSTCLLTVQGQHRGQSPCKSAIALLVMHWCDVWVSHPDIPSSLFSKPNLCWTMLSAVVGNSNSRADIDRTWKQVCIWGATDVAGWSRMSKWLCCHYQRSCHCWFAERKKHHDFGSCHWVWQPFFIKADGHLSVEAFAHFRVRHIQERAWSIWPAVSW